MPSGPIVRDYNKKFYKKCIKCRSWKPREDIEQEDGLVLKRGFGRHNSSDGLQSICYTCKNVMNTRSREKNSTARIRHHTATRCLTQLGELAPDNFTRDMEHHLGYRITKLVKHLGKDLKEREGHTRKLRDALNEGYHIDHIRPLSSFPVIFTDRSGGESVDWDVFRECWAIENLSAIPADENLAKGAKYEQAQESPEEGEEAQEAQEEEGDRDRDSDTTHDDKFINPLSRA